MHLFFNKQAHKTTMQKKEIQKLIKRIKDLTPKKTSGLKND